MKQRLFVITLSICLGIFIASKLRVPFVFVYIINIFLLILCAFCIKKDRLFGIILFFISISLGILLLINTRILPRDHIIRIIPPKGSEAYLEGVIVSDPDYKNSRFSFVLKAEKLKTANYWQRVSGKVLVRLSTGEGEQGDYQILKGLFYADRLVIKGRLYRPFYSLALRKIKYRDYLKRRGIYVVLSSSGASKLTKIKSREGHFIIYLIFRLRHRLKDMVEKNLSFLCGSVINAVILGLRQNLPQQTIEMLVNTGTVHIIAISGLHLGIVAFIILILLKSTRLRRRPRYVVTVFILFIYCILTGSHVPVIRAAIMAAVFLFGYIIKRQANLYNSLSTAALIIIFINPWQLFEISFQLSFISVFSIICFSPKIIRFFSAKIDKAQYLRLMLNVFSVSLSAWLGLFPIIAYYFKVISPIAILANLIVVPYMAVVIACGLCFILIGLICPSLLTVFSPAVEVSVLLLLKLISLLNRIPFGYFHLS